MNKKIYLYSIDKILIKEFISIQDAANFTKISRSIISRACKLNKIINNTYIFSFTLI
jgi:NUMOD1 domain